MPSRLLLSIAAAASLTLLVVLALVVMAAPPLETSVHSASLRGAPVVAK